MTNHNIDILLNRIQDSRTREYMDEVLSCYYSKNYRSAVVMLYSVVICDLIYKLQRLRDLYGDSAAIKILNDIEKLQTDNPISSIWENTIRDKLIQNQRILSPVEATHIEALQKERHLCAHPVIKNNAELHKPNQATVYSHIITALDEILTRPALLGNRLLELILNDIATQRKILRKPNEFLSYVREKFLDKIKSSEIEQKLIIGLWKFVFKLTNDDAKKNRKINLLLLNELCSRNENVLKDVILKNSEKLSSNVNIEDLDTLSSFVTFLNSHQTLYEYLTKHFKITLEAQINKYSLIKHISFFLHKDLKVFLEQLLSSVAEDDKWKYQMNYIEKRLSKEDSLRIPIAIFSRSESFNDAFSNYSIFISPYLKDMNERNLTEVLDAILNNGQIHYCYKIQDKYSIIKSTALALNPDFDFSKYSFIK